MEKSFYVYKHTTPDNRVYIGITCQNTVEDRWGNGNGYKGQYFYKGIQEFGWDNIEHKVLIHGLTKEQAEKWEIKLIKYYNSNNEKYGYNKTNGGDCVYFNNCVKIICLNDNKIYDSIASAGKFYDIYPANISKVCSGIDPHIKTLVFRYFEDYKKLTKEEIEYILKSPKKLGKIKVICLDNNTIYESASEAGRQLNIHESSITRCCNGGYRAIKGYHFMYFDDFNKTNEEQIRFILNNDKKTSSKKVVCLETKEIFKKLEDAGKKYGTTGTNIGMCCRGVNKSAVNLHWVYYTDYLQLTPEQVQEKIKS